MMTTRQKPIHPFIEARTGNLFRIKNFSGGSGIEQKLRQLGITPSDCVEAWPALIIGSILLSIFTFLDWSYYLNLLVRPISWLLGLPGEVGAPMIFGILQKELSMVMLRQALEAEDLSTVITSVQKITFSVFVVFYNPCLATLMVIKKELGTQVVMFISGFTILIATIAALIAQFSTGIFMLL